MSNSAILCKIVLNSFTFEDVRVALLLQDGVFGCSGIEIARQEEETETNLNQAVLEASGGINEQNLSLYAQAKPHFVSSGAPVHASRWLDLGLDWR